MLRIATILFSVLLFAGCATPEARIGKHPEIYAALPPDVQSAVKEGNIDVGFSTDAVYLAVGHPHRQYQRTTDQGTATIWSFVARDYYTDQQRVTANFRVRDTRGHIRTVHDSVWVNVRHEREFETLRIEFQDDAVTAIERLSRP